MRAWTTTTLGKVLHFYNGKTPVLNERGKYPVYGSNGVIGQSEFYKYKNSLIIGRVGAYCGSVNIEHGKYWASDNTIVADVVDTCDLRFFYYLLKALPLNAMAGGSAQPLVNHAILSRVNAALPPQKTQHKIAAILSAYDELIENNKRRIALLEKMADEIYREWFIRLRFPGHQTVKVVKGVPRGWLLRPFNDVVEIDPAERIDKSEDLPFVPMEQLSLTSMFFVWTEYRKGAVGAKFRNRDILFPRITPSVENGKRGFVMTLPEGQVGVGSTEFIVMREKIIGPEHIYLITCSNDFRKHAELSMTGASGRQRVQDECFSFFLVKTPPKELRDRFANVVGPYFSHIRTLSFQIEVLQKVRDSLLPRLISGKLSVSNLAIQFPPSMKEEDPTPAPSQKDRGIKSDA
jgi:type I restriction enzyme S subunit